MEDKIYIDNEICTFKTTKKLLAFSDRLNPATPVNYANLHAKDERDEQDRRVKSTIGILASDFSNGKGNANIKAQANITAAEARYIYACVEKGLGTLNGEIFSSEKIMGTPDERGYAIVKKLSIRRSSKNSKGEPQNSPWIVTVDNGKSLKVNNPNGSAYAQSGTYQSHSKVMIFLTDQEFFCLLAEVVAFISVWEVTFGPKVMREGRAMLDEAKAAHAAEQAKNPKPQQAAKPTPPPAPQRQNVAPSTPVNTGGMTLAQAMAVKVIFGKHKGRTMGEMEAESPTGVDWYINTYSGKSEIHRQAAQVIINSRNQQQAG